MFVYERAMPAMGDRGFLMQRRQRKVPIAGMARSYTGKKRACFTLTDMMRIATPRMMKNPQVVVGAGFKPALRREIGSIGLKPAPKKPRFVVTSEMFFTLKTSVVRLFVLEKPDEYRVFLG